MPKKTISDDGSEIEPLENSQVDIATVRDNIAMAKKINIVLGYGLAFANAQHAIADMFKTLSNKGGINVSFVIYPVDGRITGQLNVLLAESGVPYDIVHEMEEMDEAGMIESDVIHVIGANDTVSLAAEDPDSVLYGMPVTRIEGPL